ncbi:MAG: DNA-processing protein DprA [Ruminococcaceae bacterium]|nr:DNA-processing protein DprA [Oscillospiraceae bacterium]
MTAREEGFLLLSSNLGSADRKPLTVYQLRTLAMRMRAAKPPQADRELEAADIIALGYAPEMACRIVGLLEDKELLKYYLRKGNQAGCVPITRVSENYPVLLRKNLGLDSPGVLWAKGDLSLLSKPKVALVGSRDIDQPNAAFAKKTGQEAARQGYVLISGNARGADTLAQRACLEAGGQVISVVADELEKRQAHPNLLYLSEEGFDLPFTSVRALSRNRVIHALGSKTFVAQSGMGVGGTWSGVSRNLRMGWSPVFCFRDGREAAVQLEQLGAVLIGLSDLENFDSLEQNSPSFF